MTYARNSLGQVSGVTTKQNALAANDNVATGVTWKPMSDLLGGMTYGNGLATTAGYDLDYRLTSLLLQDGATDISSLSYAYTDGMNLTAVNDNVTPANNISLWYNPANRLQNADGSWGQSTYYYDGVGNRTYDINTVGAVTTTRIQNYPSTSNRISGMTENSAALRDYTYDAGGNILTDTRPGEVFAFTYNARNRPASVTRNSVAYATYGYNALEQLVSRATSAAGGPTGTVHYIHDLDGHIIAEADASTGATAREYIWMGPKPAPGLDPGHNQPTDLPLAVVDDVATTPVLLMVHTDHLGRPILMTDSTKATVWTASYKPWGEPLSISGTKALNLRFPGQYFQIETNLAYNWHRHYDPTTGRYTQPDPLGFVDGPSIYAYAGNSPFMYLDREGRWITVAAQVVKEAGKIAVKVCAKNASCRQAVGATMRASRDAAIAAGRWISRMCRNIFKRSKNTDEETTSQRPSRVRKGTEQSNWDNAEDGANGGKLCPTCDKEVQSPPGEKGRDWDNDHYPRWRDRDLRGMNREEVLDEYNRNTRLRCVNCNRSDNGR